MVGDLETWPAFDDEALAVSCNVPLATSIGVVRRPKETPTEFNHTCDDFTLAFQDH